MLSEVKNTGGDNGSSERCETEFSEVNNSPDHHSKAAVSNENKNGRRVPVCWFYSRNGQCRYEDACRFKHSIPHTRIIRQTRRKNNVEKDDRFKTAKQDESSEETSNKDTLPDENGKEDNQAEESDNQTEREGNRKQKPSRPKANRSCIFFRRNGSCRFNERCHFSHEEPNYRNRKNLKENKAATPENEETVEIQDEAKIVPRERFPLRDINLEDLDNETVAELRAIEIKLMQKRFRGKKFKQVDENFLVLLKATDPDWPFDIRTVWLLVEIPESYPKEDLLQVVVTEEDNGSLPHLLIKYLNERIMKWIEERHIKNANKSVTELVFRPFSRWFDRNLEKLFEEGLKMTKRYLEAKAAGLEFVPFVECGVKKPEVVTDDEKLASKDDELICIMGSKDEKEEVYQPIDEDVKSACLELCNLNVDRPKAAFVPTDENQHKGTAIKLVEYELSESIATLVCTKMAVVLSCTRCRSKTDFVGMARKPNRLSCVKCNHVMNATFRSAMLHQFSAIVGYLDLEGCRAFDVTLIRCEFNATCLGCGKSSLISGLANGQTSDTFCFICHQKQTITIKVFKFQVLDDPINSGQLDYNLIKKKKEAKDTAIQDGKPLPNNGICKHYKKSYRWLRFPCCGKCYPCDLCHDEKEMDHDMEFAVRMLCGYCAKEQTFGASKPCMRCHADLTKKSTGHWDNGKGCRNKVKMSKDDKQKYVGLNKTVAKSVEVKKSQKKTK